MRSTAADLETFLEELARNAQPGDQLPTIRELMRQFGLSQMLVQKGLRKLKTRGLIESQVGRGTHFRGTGNHLESMPSKGTLDSTDYSTPSGVKSILLLRRSISIARGRMLVEGLQRRLVAEGHRVVEVSYTDPDHALTVLKGLPRFDACVVQSTYKTIPIALLAALKQKSDLLAVDGTALVGADIEAVGMEWGEPLASAIEMLRQKGHRDIAYATTTSPFLAVQMGRRRFRELQKNLKDIRLSELQVSSLPDADYVDVLVELLQSQRDRSGRLPFTALVAWGIEDGATFREMLKAKGIEIPSMLSVVLLGRTDLANEHAEFFWSFGCSVADQVETLYASLQARWSDPASPYGVRLTPVTVRSGASVSERKRK